MRVIAGTAKRLQLKTVKGDNTRPTTDRIKETLFNMLQNDIEGCRFLDLFSGSGAIGIEALSRGAKEAVFVENNKEAINCIKENLIFTKLVNSGIVMSYDVMTAISMLEGRNAKFDIVFMDPPYNKEIEKEVLDRLKQSEIIDSDTMIIVEASLNTSFSYLRDMGYELFKEKKYKTNKHMFIYKN
ncbi:MAG: 16S rRNA (guanine(966)-N(2))-methyltransferase RsmD [Clostridiales bacterium]|jgi:16S rRNA (guanine966-N2)-methyltransferase|uniref:16S rRNA (guanine(966)-N(2))-methyltransferase RsmD n=1 Tax=Bovifimicola ammoniilytica TaxID=2981720 RepID=UPI00033D577B|nr:16S rRNA (guanine(966)-N(2))-methyltransferase RsmD [Bovifimicola ammoniilytica]MBD8943201.1 16S rRNA (guanine(966)-N(2))-methyltransferase RsmD [Clostridiales bacterium]MCU6752594.1 16S rRNA (guanine(966)-N(2))-methyltransferase RsmD [Bovifimicola ammoniilytica]CCZ04751.1 rNA methyltransferase RsmD family [Eubacterium sp. CAG:603]SCJ30206.1 Ribosomal RNA small subunit methyltransferase D [uncultured Eubacterium sp.]